MSAWRQVRSTLLLTLILAAPTMRAQGVSQVTVPLIVEKNRPFIEVAFKKPDGTVRTARLLLDTGGGGFLITEQLARDIGVKWGATSTEEGTTFGEMTNLPIVALGAFQLKLHADNAFVVIGKTNILSSAVAGVAEGMIPGHVLSQYHVVFDYPAGKLTVANAGVLTPNGTELPMPVGRTGFPRTEITVAGSTYGLLLDTGASFTMVSEVLLKSWGTSHPDWPRYTGAHGEAATLGGMTLETMYLPGAHWGSFDVPEFGVVSQRAGAFERVMSGMMSAPIIGSLAGNVLKNFRVDLDYPNKKLYLSRKGAP